MILKLFYLIIISLFSTKIINASTKFSKNDHPHLQRAMIDFVEAGFDKLMDKEEREIRALQILFKNKDYIAASMESGFGSTLIKYMQSRNSALQLEAIKSVKKAAVLNKEYAEEIVDEGAIPELIKLLHSTNPKIVVEALKAIGVIVHKNYKLRDQFLVRGLAEHLVEFADPKSSKELLSEIVQVITLLILDMEHQISKTTVKTILPVFKDLIRHSNSQIAKDITWLLVLLTDGGNNKYKIYITKEVFKDLFKLLNHQDPNLKAAAVGVISNVVDGENDQTKMALDNGILKFLPEFLMQVEENEYGPGTIVKDTLLMLTKFMAVTQESPEDTKTIIFDTRIVPLITYHLARGNFDEQKEAAWTLSVAAFFGNETHISKMVDLNVVTPMCKLLIKVQKTSPELTEKILLGLSEILEKSKADRIEEIYYDLEKCGGIEIIDDFGEHGKDETKILAHKIMKNFCTAESEEVCKTSAF